MVPQRLGIIGSAPLLRHPKARHILLTVLKIRRPSGIWLIQTPQFNAEVKQVAESLNIPVHEMPPQRPFWIGECPQSYRKRCFRQVQGDFLLANTDEVLVVMSGERAPSIRDVVQRVERFGGIVRDLDFDPCNR